MPDRSIDKIAAFLAECLEQLFGLRLPANFADAFAWHARRLGSRTDYEDFASLVLLECQERRQAGEPIAADDVLRLLDRVRHRLMRQSNKIPQTGRDLATIAAPEEKPPLSGKESVVAGFLDKLDCQTLVVFKMRYLDEMSVAEISDFLGIPASTIYRWLSAARDQFKVFLSRPQP